MRGDRAVSEPTWLPTEDDLEQALTDLGRHVVYPPLEPIDAVVRERLRAEPDRHASRTVHVAVRGLWRRLLLALLALAVLAGGALAASPGARTAVASWFGLQGVVFLYRPAPPPRSPAPVGAPFGLGQRLILPALGAPDEVYLEALPHGTQVGLVYRPRPGLPAHREAAPLLVHRCHGRRDHGAHSVGRQHAALGAWGPDLPAGVGAAAGGRTTDRGLAALTRWSTTGLLGAAHGSCWTEARHAD